MVKRLTLLCVVLACLGGCKIDEQMAISQGRDMFSKTLKDGGSAEFEGVFFRDVQDFGNDHHGYLCGRVNSKDSFGGYTGSERFRAHFNWSESGRFHMDDPEIEEGLLAKQDPSDEGRTYFQSNYWLPDCDGVAKKDQK